MTSLPMSKTIKTTFDCLAQEKPDDSSTKHNTPGFKEALLSPMKVAVIGAGIAGIATAYELAAQNHEVSVFERHGASAEECSFANAGIISHYESAPWTRPSLGWEVFSSLFKNQAPTRLLKLRWQEFKWLKKCRQYSDLELFESHYKQLFQLSQYSQACLHQLRQQLRFEYDQSAGHLVLLREADDELSSEIALDVLRDVGLNFKILNPQEARQIEPALNPETPIHQAIYFPEDETGNCRQFTLLLKGACEAMGVNFHFNTAVQGLQPGSKPRVMLADKSLTFDAIVVCAGLSSSALLKPLGIKIPLAAMHAYSISASVREPMDAPKSSVMDEHFKVSISRLGQRVRISGAREIGGNAKHQEASLKLLYQVLDDWFPGAARIQDSIQVWKGAYPVLADSKPILGATPAAGVWVNIGHGLNAWTQACGSARVVARQVSDRQDEIELTGMGLDRFYKRK